MVAKYPTEELEEESTSPRFTLYNQNSANRIHVHFKVYFVSHMYQEIVVSLTSSHTIFPS